MERKLKVVGGVCVALVGLALVVYWFCFERPARQAKAAEEREFEMAYREWHAAIDNRGGEPPYWFYEYGWASNALKKIKGYGLRMADFMCDKVANEPDTITETVYEDIKLLDWVAGVNLWYADRRSDNVRADMAVFKARFREEWRAGFYQHPDEKVAEALEPLIRNEPCSSIDPRQLATVSRFGIYSMPELIRQIKKHNSTHAFVLCLRARLEQPGERSLYSEYIKNCDKMFVTKEEKLKHLEEKLQELQANAEGEVGVVKKIEAALRE